MDFTDPMERLAAGDQIGEFQFEADMINTFFGVCESASLAMGTVMSLINNQFGTSNTFSAWSHQRSLEHLESLPGYLENVLKAEIDLSRIPKFVG